MEQDAARGRLNYVTQGGDEAGMVKAESALADCYMKGNSVEADTVHAVLWCQRAADGGGEVHPRVPAQLDAKLHARAVLGFQIHYGVQGGGDGGGDGHPAAGVSLCATLCVCASVTTF